MSSKGTRSRALWTPLPLLTERESHYARLMADETLGGNYDNPSVSTCTAPHFKKRKKK